MANKDNYYEVFREEWESFGKSTGVPPLKWSTNWDSLIPFRRTRDGRKARQTRRDRAEASPS